MQTAGRERATLTVIGVDGEHLPPGAARALDAARLVVADAALLRAHPGSSDPNGWSGSRDTIELTGSLVPPEVLDKVVSAVSTGDPAVIMVPGDPGFFGPLRTLRSRGVPVVTWPSVSQLQRLAAMIQRPWDDITVVDARGQDFTHALNVCRARRAVAVVTGPDAGPNELAAGLDGWRRTVAVLEDPGGPTEKLSIVDAREAERRRYREPNLVLCLTSVDSTGKPSWIAGGELVPPADGWALDESAFASRDGVMIAPEVRALALAKLAPRPGTLLWDVAAGSGAVGIEAGRLGAAVIAIEADSGLCVRIVSNAGAHGVDLRLVDAPPPRSLANLPAPDAIAVGSTREDVLRAVVGVDARRIVVLGCELDRVTPTRDVLAGAGYEVGGVQLSAAPLTGLDADGTGVGVGPAHSTFLLWGKRIGPGRAR